MSFDAVQKAKNNITAGPLGIWGRPRQITSLIDCGSPVALIFRFSRNRSTRVSRSGRDIEAPDTIFYLSRGEREVQVVLLNLIDCEPMRARGRHRVRQDDRNSVAQRCPLIPPRIDAADRDRFGVWDRGSKKTRVGSHEPPFGHAIIMRLTRFAAPRRGIGSSPGQELLGVITSHGPSRDCYTLAQKSSGWSAQAPGMSAADAAVSAQRLRPALPSAAIMSS